MAIRNAFNLYVFAHAVLIVLAVAGAMARADNGRDSYLQGCLDTGMSEDICLQNASDRTMREVR